MRHVSVGQAEPPIPPGIRAPSATFLAMSSMAAMAYRTRRAVTDASTPVAIGSSTGRSIAIGLVEFAVAASGSSFEPCDLTTTSLAEEETGFPLPCTAR